MVAQSSGHTLELQDDLPIDDVTKHAFLTLGEKRVVKSAENHFCSDCIHDYKHTADIITGDDPAALVGVDEITMCLFLQVMMQIWLFRMLHKPGWMLRMLWILIELHHHLRQLLSSWL
jgi:uncharacterized protein (DUF983 family)